MKPWESVLLVLIGGLLAGCAGHNQRLVEFVEQASQRQAEQDREMSRLNREVAEGTKRLVESGAAATEKTLTMQQDVQEQRNRLETERQGLATERTRESLLVPVLQLLGFLLVCGLPLVLCWYLLAGLGRSAEGDALNVLLVDELIADQTALKSDSAPPSALPGSSQPSCGEF